MATQHRYLVPISEVRHADENTPSASRIYRNVTSKDKMPVLEATTLHELFQGSVRKYGDANCLGWRPIDHATGKADDYQWVTYNEANTKIESIASGLAGLGLAKSDRVGIYGVNCPEWMITMQVGATNIAYTVVLLCKVHCLPRNPRLFQQHAHGDACTHPTAHVGSVITSQK